MRLERQRRTRRAHVRTNSRWYRRGYATLPHEVWGDTARPPSTGGISPPPTGVTVGSPGTFTPAGSVAPYDLAALQAMGALGQTAAWTTGQYVKLRNNQNANWTGTAWAAGIHAAEDEQVNDPGSFTIADLETWVDAHADQAGALLSAEQARSTPRVTLVDWLQGFISHRDEGTIP